jgi:hypothetical protein
MSVTGRRRRRWVWAAVGLVLAGLGVGLATDREGYDPATLRAMLTATGGERLTLDDGGWRRLPDGRLRPDAP